MQEKEDLVDLYDDDFQNHYYCYQDRCYDDSVLPGETVGMFLVDCIQPVSDVSHIPKRRFLRPHRLFR